MADEQDWAKQEQEARANLEAAQVRVKDLLDESYKLDEQIDQLREQKRSLSEDLAGALEQHQAAQFAVAEATRQGEQPAAVAVEIGPAVDTQSSGE